MKIQDGKGRGPWAGVNRYHQLLGKTTIESLAHFVSEEEGDVFTIPTNLLTITLTEGGTLYIRNDHDTKMFFPSVFCVSSNGGSTTGGKTIIMRIYMNPSVPSANFTQTTPSPTNGLSGKKAPLTVYKWNGTGTGMTIASNGTLLLGFHQDKGSDHHYMEDSLILGPGQSCLVTAQAEEIGTFMINTLGFMYED